MTTPNKWKSHCLVKLRRNSAKSDFSLIWPLSLLMLLLMGYYGCGDRERKYVPRLTPDPQPKTGII